MPPQTAHVHRQFAAHLPGTAVHNVVIGLVFVLLVGIGQHPRRQQHVLGLDLFHRRRGVGGAGLILAGRVPQHGVHVSLQFLLDLLPVAVRFQIPALSQKAGKERAGEGLGIFQREGVNALGQLAVGLGKRRAQNVFEHKTAFPAHMIMPGVGDDILALVKHVGSGGFAVQNAFRLAFADEVRVVDAAHFLNLRLGEEILRDEFPGADPLGNFLDGLLPADGKGQHLIWLHVGGQLALQHHRAVAVVAMGGHRGLVSHDLAAAAGAVVDHLRAGGLLRLSIRFFLEGLRLALQLRLRESGGTEGAFPLLTVRVEGQVSAAIGAFVGYTRHVFTSLHRPFREMEYPKADSYAQYSMFFSV